MLTFFFFPDKNPINMEDNHPFSLIFSWKNFGAFEFAFITPVLMTEVPIILTFTNKPIIDLGISLLLIFWAGSFGFFAYRNWIKD